MGKSSQEKNIDQQGTPSYVIVSVLFAIMIFAVEGFKESIGVNDEVISGGLRMTNLAFIALGLALCFFWRRMRESALKFLSAFIFTSSLWLYLLLMVLGPLLFHGPGAETKLLFVNQFGFASVLVSCLVLLATLFYDSRLVPSLMMTAIAGLLTSLASVWGFFQFSHGVQRPAAQDLTRHEAHGEHDSGTEEEEIHSAHFSGEQGDEENGHGAEPEAVEEEADEHRSPRAIKVRKTATRDHDSGSETGKGRLKLSAKHLEQDSPADKHLSRHTVPASKHPQQSKGEKPRSGKKLALHAASEPKKIHWEYEGEHGPEAWGDLSRDFKLCAEGSEQSPIDIPENWPLQHNLQLHYRPSSFEAIDNGHTIQFNIEAGNYIMLGNKPYELKQIHFHTPSEHFVNGRSSILEAHFVHATARGELAVLGSMIEAGVMHREYQKIWEFIPKRVNVPVKARGKLFDPRALLPKDLSIYNYNGSLTTPPCSEKVNWNVLRDPVHMSQEQINRLRSKYRNNARPIQALHER